MVPKAGLVISLENTDLWAPPNQIIGSFCGENDLKSNLEKAISVSLIKGNCYGLGQLLPHVLDNFQHVDVENLSVVARVAFPRILALTESIALKDFGGIAKPVWCNFSNRIPV